jgi:hypothetical protein
MEDTDNDLSFGLYEAICQACDAHAMVNDIGLCEYCDAKMDRDLIRKREWDYSATAFGCPVDKREELRKHIIAQHGETLEILSAEPPRKERSTSRNQKRKGKKPSGSGVGPN